MRATAKRGKESMVKKICKERPLDKHPRYDKEHDLYCTKVPIETDFLTKIIFDKIKEIEKESGYCPELKVAKKEGRPLARPSNWLGNITRYYWVKEDPENQMAGVVKVKSNFCNKERLLAVVQSYDVGYEKKLSS